MTDAELINDTMRISRRSSFVLNLSYATTETQMKAILNDLRTYLSQQSLLEENPTVRFRRFAESSMDISVIFFVKTSDMNVFLIITEEINFRIMEIVQKHGAEFAFPSTTVYLKKD